MNSIPLFEETRMLMPEDVYQPLNDSLKTLEILHLKLATYSQQNKVRFNQSTISFELIKTNLNILKVTQWIHLLCFVVFDF